MNDFYQHVTDGQLHVLAYEPEDSLEAVDIARHVESCDTCQIRLTELTTDAQIELEASQLLSGYETTERGNFHTSNFPVASDKEAENALDEGLLDQGLLDPATHPEMLGRIGRYEIERRIGSGGMGVVFKAIDSELNRPVAVKVLAPHLSRNGAARQRFSRESRAAAAVVHEHVVAIHNVEANAEHPYIVMQYVSGESLQARVDRVGPLDAQQILRIGVQAARGLAAAHQQGIIHRDIKPANILLEDGVERLLITDFGLARTVDDASLTHTGVVAGTPNYMSPEQASGVPVDHRSDLFSLGSVLYFVATGHPPFRAERAMGVLHRICQHRHRPVWQVNSTIPDELSAVIDRLLEKRPSKRFASAEAAADVMSRILANLQHRRPRLSLRLRSWGRRHRRVSWLAASALLVTASVTALLYISPSGWQGVPAGKTVTPSSGDGRLAESDSPTADLGTDPTMQSSENNSEIAAILDSGDRSSFDRHLSEITNSLQEFENGQETYGSDPSHEFQLELRGLEQALDHIDPTLTP